MITSHDSILECLETLDSVVCLRLHTGAFIYHASNALSEL